MNKQRQDRTPAGNRRLAQWRVTWLIEHSTSHQLLWCIDSFVLRNPPLRQAPKRYLQAPKMKIVHLIKILVISMFISSCGMNSIDGMKNNIDNNSKEIIELKNYLNEIVPKDYEIRLQ